MSNGHEILVLRDVLIPGGRVADITIIDGKVLHIGSAGKGDSEIHCRGKMLIPAGTDLHVHMRDGTQKQKENWETGTKSAIAGGVTVVVDQPNTVPALTTPESVQNRVNLACSQSYCRFAVNGAVTSEADLPGMWKAGVFAFGETFAGPSSYGEAVGPMVLSQAMQQISSWDGLMTIHAEQVMDGEDINLIQHDSLRPVSGEVQAVQDLIKINNTQCRIHFCHLSSSQAINAVPDGTATIEVTPHHLFLSLEDFPPENTQGKVNPPLRSEKIRKELFSRWNRIDIIASDHAPHTAGEKGQSFDLAPSGMPGCETMIPLLMRWVVEKKISLVDLIQKTSIQPSRMLGIPCAGYIPGDRADFALYPMDPTIIQSENLHSRAGWSPYEGMKAVFPDIVLLGGSIVFEHGDFFHPEMNPLQQSELIESCKLSPSPLWIPGRGYTLE